MVCTIAEGDGCTCFNFVDANWVSERRVEQVQVDAVVAVTQRNRRISAFTLNNVVAVTSRDGGADINAEFNIVVAVAGGQRQDTRVDVILVVTGRVCDSDCFIVAVIWTLACIRGI